jgi:hypothetical protein
VARLGVAAWAPAFAPIASSRPRPRSRAPACGPWRVMTLITDGVETVQPATWLALRSSEHANPQEHGLAEHSRSATACR